VTDWGPITSRNDSRILPPDLVSPEDGAIVTDSRNPVYIWNNSEHTLSDNVTYHIQVDDDSGFDSPALDVANITEGSVNTSYWNDSNLQFSTDYFWRVRANDTYNVSLWSDAFNFSILPTPSCSEPIEEINFGNMCILEDQQLCNDLGLGSHINDTLDNHPPPYSIENDGNLKAKGKLYSTQLWTSPSIPTMPHKYYQFMVGENESSSYDWALDSSWVNMSDSLGSAPLAFHGLKWVNVSDIFNLHIRLESPTDEPAGLKYSTSYIECEQNETY
jgi:hypothetical protein